MNVSLVALLREHCPVTAAVRDANKYVGQPAPRRNVKKSTRCWHCGIWNDACQRQLTCVLSETVYKFGTNALG